MQTELNQDSLLNYYMTHQKSRVAANTGVQSPKVDAKIYTQPEYDYFDNPSLKTEKKSKKYKVAKTALIIGTALIGAGLTFVGIKNRSGIEKFIKAAYSDVKNGGVQKSFKDIIETVSNGDKRKRFFDAIINGKDTVTRKVFWKVPGYKRFYDTPTSNMYRKIASGVMKKSWGKAATAAKEADSALLKALEKSGMDESLIARAKEYIAKRGNAISDFASQERVSERFGKIDSALKDLHTDGWKTLTDKGKTIRQKIAGVFEENLAQGRIDSARKLQEDLIGKFQHFASAGLNENEARELADVVAKLTKENPELAQKLEQASKVYGKTYAKEAIDMFNKVRDINFGSAPTDITTILTATGAMGIYTAQADTKEERVSVTLTSGIPLIGTLAASTVCQAKMQSGGKSLLIGATVGLITKMIGKFANNAYKKYNKTKAEKSIPHTEDYLKMPSL